jgi:hypothetical protein
MKLDSKKKCTVLDGTGMLVVNVIFVSYGKSDFTWKQERLYRLHKHLIQSSHKYDGNLCYLWVLRRSCMVLTKHFHLFPSLRMSSGVPLLPSAPSCMLRLYWNSYMQIQYLTFIWRLPFDVTDKCIAMLSITNSSILRMLEWVLCDWKQCCTQHLIP